MSAKVPLGSPLAKLTEQLAIAILNDEERTQEQIAAHYGVSQSLVSAIKTGVRWRHVQ
jgi:DNA-directed RNA polymerase specialized sigma subunit